MSRYRGNDERCPHCGIAYRDFRCNLSFRDAAARLWSHDTDTKNWKYKRRNTVLGVMHAEKRMFWRLHKENGCALIPQHGDAWIGDILDERVAGVPF